MNTPSLRKASPREPAPVAEWLLLGMTALAVALGFADPDRAQLPVARACGLVVLPVVLAVRGGLQPSQSARRGLRTPLWVPAVAVLAAVLVQAAGGPVGLLTPVAFLAAVAISLGTSVGRGLPWGLVLAGSLLVPGWFGWAAVASVPAQIVFALGVMICVSVPGRALGEERLAHARTRARLRGLEDEASGLRSETNQVVPTLRSSGYDQEERERDLRSIARELQQDMDRAASLLLSASGGLAVTIFRPDGEEDGERLVVVAQAGDTRTLLPEVGAREGLFGAAFKAGTPVLLRQAEEGDRRIVHRRTCDGLGSVLALPLVDGDRRWGVVVLDSESSAAITDRVRELAGNVADFVARLIARAVDLSAVREGMRENHAFYEACREVSRHVRISEVAEAIVNSLGDFVELDACAVVLADSCCQSLEVVADRGFAEVHQGRRFPVRSGEGLLAQAVRHRTEILRHGSGPSGPAPLLFGQEGGPQQGFAAFLVLPLFAPGGLDIAPLGAVVLGRHHAPDFSVEDSERVAVLLAQAGASIANGRLFAEHETRSITDGMTGLPNHGRLQEVLCDKLAASDRTQLPLSLLLLDIDKFKSVNDTYGHPMGDEVIRRLAGVLGDAVREGTDLAARYGGEEFCLLLDDTDAEGALVLADRIRNSFKEEVFVYADGLRPVSFHCTVSIGVASYPADAETQAELIERTDQALYASKEGGRDASTSWSTLRPSETRSGSVADRPAPFV